MKAMYNKYKSVFWICSVILFIVIIIFVCTILPVSADKAIFGDTFKHQVMTYAGTMQGCFRSENLISEFPEDKQPIYKYDVTHLLTDEFDARALYPTVHYSGRYVYASLILELEEENIVFEFRGKRKWFGYYTDWEMITDIDILAKYAL